MHPGSTAAEDEGITMIVDGNGVRVLTEQECRARLGSHHVHVGRFAFVQDGYPVVLPVNYRLVDGDVVFRTGLGGKLDAALRGNPVSFEVDDVDVAWEEGWSVLVKGKAEEVTDASALVRLNRMPIRPWSPGNKSRYIRVNAESITGRQIN